MRSPLEHEPELISGVGLLTVRWAALERNLADLLGTVMSIPPAGEPAYFALANFSQRKDFVEKAVTASLREDLHRRIVAALFAKIGRIWNKRNYLTHSHYVYCGFGPDGDVVQVYVEAGQELGQHPSEFGRPKFFVSAPDGEKYLIEMCPVISKGFAYQKRQMDGSIKYVPVNKGTFETHAGQVSKRIRQIKRLNTAIKQMDAPLRWGASSSSHGKPSLRGLRNQLAYREHLERELKRLPQPPPSQG